MYDIVVGAVTPDGGEHNILEVQITINGIAGQMSFAPRRDRPELYTMAGDSLDCWVSPNLLSAYHSGSISHEALIDAGVRGAMACYRESKNHAI